MLKIKRTNSEVECECCGRMFHQIRWWQAFCSTKCRRTVEKSAKQRVRILEEENRKLRERIDELENNAREHSRTSNGNPNPSFKYDDDNQEYWR